MKKKKFIVFLSLTVVILFVVISLYMNNSKKISYSIDNIEPDVFYVDGEKYILEKGRTLEIDAWNPPTKIKYKGNKSNEIPVLFNGVTLGTKVKDVIKKFKIQSGYANLNMEVAAAGSSGNTDIENVIYEDNKSLPKDFLDCLIIFGYKEVEEGWEMIPYFEIDEADIIYYIDICGFFDEEYGYNEVIEINVKYLSEEEKNKSANSYGYNY